MRYGKFTVFDVETPKSANDRMSAIGIAVVENGVITEEFSTLINPETWFNGFNIELTGITPEMASIAPSFPELWPVIERAMDGAVLVAHNAPFDMGVLSKCLRAYGIHWKRTAEYACTCRMGRVCCPEFENHKLNTMCGELGIELDHHQAGSDTHACAELLLYYISRGLDVGRFIRRYDLMAGRTLTGRTR